MTAIAGHNATIRLGDGATPVESFTEIAGLDLCELSIVAPSLPTLAVNGDGFATLNAGQGKVQVQLQLQGFVEDDAIHASLQGHALAGDTPNVQVELDSGESYSGAFKITEYQRRADMVSVQVIQLRLVSAGTVSYA